MEVTDWVVRNLESLNWVVFVKTFILFQIYLFKVLYPKTFKLFILLPYNLDNYINLYPKNFTIYFQGVWLTLQTLLLSSLTLSIWYFLKSFPRKFMSFGYLDILFLLFCFFEYKTLLRYILGKVFDLRKIFPLHGIKRLSQVCYASLVLYASTIFIPESSSLPKWYIMLVIFFFILIVVSEIISSTVKEKSILVRNLIYYILYICILDVVPLVVMYKILF